MIDQIPWDVWLWLREGRLPPDEVVKRVEQALQLQPGSLSISPEVRKWHREIPTRSRAFARIRDVGENPSSPFAGAVASLMFDRRMLVIPLAAATNLSRSMLTKYLHNGVVPDDLGITLRLEDAFHVPRCTLAQHVPPDARGRRMAEGKLREARIRFGEEFESKTDYPSRGVEWIWRNTAEHAMCISEVAIELDMWIENVTPWYSGVTLPSKRMARRLELLFRTVGLESLIADERAEGNSARQRWKRQVATRKKNYTATALKRKYDRGEFTRNGPWSETRKLGPPAHKGRRMKIRGRVHLVFAGFVAAYEKQQSYIAFCYRCNIALFRPNSSRPLSGHHYHGSCRFGNVGNDPKLAANVRFGRGRWPSGRSIVYVIEHEILEMSHAEIARRHGLLTFGNDEGVRGAGREVVKQAIKQARKYLPDTLLWRDLFYGAGSRSSSGSGVNVHQLLAPFTLGEIVQIAKGRHPLSDSTDDSEVEAYVAPRQPLSPVWEITNFVPTPLAVAVVEKTNRRYLSRRAAATAIGIRRGALTKILNGRLSYLWGRSLTSLAHHLGRSESEVRELIAQSAPAA